jgi:hypothetical protein
VLSRQIDWRSILDGRKAWDELPARVRLRTSIVAVSFCAASVVAVWTGWAEAHGGRLWVTAGAVVVGVGFIHYGLGAAREMKKR